MAEPHVITVDVYDEDERVQTFHLETTGKTLNSVLDPVFDWMSKNFIEEKKDG